jgi:peptide/nickel transport system permease protein
MVKYCVKRILLALLILFGVSVILYFLVRMMPVSYLEDKLASSLGSSAGDISYEERLKEMKEYYGLADESFFGVCKGYLNWLINFLKGDMGRSFKYNRPVGDVIFQNMGISFLISFVSLILQLVIAVPLGIKCACNQYGKLDYTATVLTMIGISFPTFFFGNLMIKIFALELGWFPVNGIKSSLPVGATGWEIFIDQVWHLILPMFVLVLLSIGSMMRYTRTNTLEVLNADYIRTARAKGLSENTVVYKHVFRNTLIPLVTTLAGILPGLFGGSMITETVFGIPGIGKTAYDALSAGDIPFIMGYNMFIAILTVIGILLTDIMYAVVDPRVKLGK